LVVAVAFMWGGFTHRLCRRGRPSDFVSVPRTLTGALKVPGTRGGAGPLKATTQDAPYGCGYLFDFLPVFLAESTFRLSDSETEYGAVTRMNIGAAPYTNAQFSQK